MTTFRFRNGHIVTPDAVLTDATLRIEGDRIASVEAGVDSDPASNAETVDLDGGWIMPGFVDTQVNGGGGVLFNDATTVEGIAAIGAAHAPFGTTAFMVTLISDTPRTSSPARSMRSMQRSTRAYRVLSESMSRARSSAPRARAFTIPRGSRISTTSCSRC